MGSEVDYFKPEYSPLPEKEEKEKCVNCGAETPYTINTHVDQRTHYVEGAGQLCKECYQKIVK